MTHLEVPFHDWERLEDEVLTQSPVGHCRPAVLVDLRCLWSICRASNIHKQSNIDPNEVVTWISVSDVRGIAYEVIYQIEYEEEVIQARRIYHEEADINSQASAYPR
jgi:hypothetical protein